MATKKTTIKKKPVAKKKAAPKYKTSIANRWMTRKKIKFETVEELEEHISIGKDGDSYDIKES